MKELFIHAIIKDIYIQLPSLHCSCMLSTHEYSQEPGFRGRATGALCADFATTAVNRGNGFQSSPGRDSRIPQTEAHI